MAESICGGSITTNVGSFDCDNARKFPKKLFIGSKAFTPIEFASESSFLDALIGAVKTDSGNDFKLYPVHNLRNPQDTTAANVTGAVGEGPQEVISEAAPSFTYEIQVGQDLFKRLRKLNGQTVQILTQDSGNRMWGAKDASGNFIGCRGTIFFSGNRQSTATTLTSALITVTYLSAVQYNDEAFYMPISLNEFEPAGLLDAEIKLDGTKAINAFGTVVGGSGYVNGTYPNVALTGGTGTGAKATVVVAGAVVTTVTKTDGGKGYTAADSLSAPAASLGGTGTGFSVPVTTISNNVFDIKVEIQTAQINTFINVAKKYASQLIVSLFRAWTGATFAIPVTITSYSYDATTETGTITFDQTQINGLANGAKIKLDLVDVALLDAADIPDIEAVPLILTKAA